jgi:hypothetical protein
MGGPNSMGVMAAAASPGGGGGPNSMGGMAAAAAASSGSGSGSRIDPMNGIRVSHIDPATSTAMILYQPFDRTAPIPESNEGTTANAEREAIRARVSDSAILKTFLRLLIVGAVEVPIIGGRYLISQILSTMEKNNRTPSTLLDAIRISPDIQKSDISYEHPLFQALKTEAAKPRPEIDAGTIAAGIEAYTIGLQSFRATYNMLLSFNELMNTYPPLRPQTNSGPRNAAAAVSMIPAGIAGKECDLVKKYMIFVYYIRKKYMIRSAFSEDWASIDSDISSAFMKNAPKGMIVSLLEMIKLRKPVPQGARNVSRYTFRGAQVTLVSQNEMRLINGIISNIAQNESLCTDPELKIKFSQFLTMTEMDVAQIVPERRLAFEEYVKGLISKATSGAGGPKSAIEMALGGTSGRNVRPVFDLAAQKRVAAEAAARAAEAAAAAEGIMGGPVIPSFARQTGRALGLGLGGAAVGVARTGISAASSGAMAAGSAAAQTGRNFARGVGEGFEPVSTLISNATELLKRYGGITAVGVRTLGYGIVGVYNKSGMLITKLRQRAGGAAGGPVEYMDIGLEPGNIMPGPGNWGGEVAPSSASSAGSGGGTNTARIAGEKRKREEETSEERAAIMAGIPEGQQPLPAKRQELVTRESIAANAANAAAKAAAMRDEGKGNQGGGYRRTRRAAKRHSRRIVHHKKKQTRSRKRVTRRR